jgi:integrase
MIFEVERFRAWPEADRALWERLTADGDPLEERGPLAHLRPSSLLSIANAYQRWLAWLGKRDLSALTEQPAVRATPARLKAWIADLEDHAPLTQFTYVERTLRLLAAEAPEQDWAPHRRCLALLRRRGADAASGRRPGRLPTSGDLVCAGLTWAGGDVEDTSNDGTSFRAAKRLRDGVMIAVLALMPIRRRAFCGLELGRSVLLRGTDVIIVLEGADTKSGTTWEAAVPDPVRAPLLRYIAEMRPPLMSRTVKPHCRLWVGDHGRPYSDIHLGERIARITEWIVGTRLSPHAFRHVAATTLALASPDAARLTRAILGHTSFRVAERHYNRATTLDASRAYAKLIGSRTESRGKR